MSFLTSNSSSSLDISADNIKSILPGGFNLTKESSTSLITGNHKSTYEFLSDSKFV